MAIVSLFILVSAVAAIIWFYTTVSDKKEENRKQREEKLNEQTEQVWKEYMGVRFPIMKYELGIWNGMSVTEKKAWVKKLKDDIRTGKKIPVKDENGEVIGYKVKDRKTIVNETVKEELAKKIYNI